MLSMQKTFLLCTAQEVLGRTRLGRKESWVIFVKYFVLPVMLLALLVFVACEATVQPSLSRTDVVSAIEARGVSVSCLGDACSFGGANGRILIYADEDEARANVPGLLLEGSRVLTAVNVVVVVDADAPETTVTRIGDALVSLEE